MEILAEQQARHDAQMAAQAEQQARRDAQMADHDAFVRGSIEALVSSMSESGQAGRRRGADELVSRGDELSVQSREALLRGVGGLAVRRLDMSEDDTTEPTAGGLSVGTDVGATVGAERDVCAVDDPTVGTTPDVGTVDGETSVRAVESSVGIAPDVGAERDVGAVDDPSVGTTPGVGKVDGDTRFGPFESGVGIAPDAGTVGGDTTAKPSVGATPSQAKPSHNLSGPVHLDLLTAEPSQNFSRPDLLAAKPSQIFSNGVRGGFGVGSSLLGAGLHPSGMVTSGAGGGGRGGASADVNAVARMGRRPDPLSLLTPGGHLKRQLGESPPSAANQPVLLSPPPSRVGSGSRIVGGVLFPALSVPNAGEEALERTGHSSPDLHKWYPGRHRGEREGDSGPPDDGDGSTDVWINKALAPVEVSSHRYWKVVYKRAIVMERMSERDAAECFSKLIGIGVVAIYGITKNFSLYNALKEGLSVKKHKKKGAVDTARLSESLEKSDVYNKTLARLTSRVVATGKATLPLTVIKEFLAVLSAGRVLVPGEHNLVDAVRGLDYFLAAHGTGALFLENVADTETRFAVVNDVDVTALVEPLPPGLGAEEPVAGVNDTVYNANRT